jgi:hypothetical protein
MRLFNWEFFSVSVKTSKKIRISVVNTYYRKRRKTRRKKGKRRKKEGRKDV